MQVSPDATRFYSCVEEQGDKKVVCPPLSSPPSWLLDVTAGGMPDRGASFSFGSPIGREEDELAGAESEATSLQRYRPALTRSLF